MTVTTWELSDEQRAEGEPSTIAQCLAVLSHLRVTCERLPGIGADRAMLRSALWNLEGPIVSFPIKEG